MRWLRDWAQWWHARQMRPTQGLMTCIHPTPPGFSKCKFKVSYCLTCGQAFKC